MNAPTAMSRPTWIRRFAAEFAQLNFDIPSPEIHDDAAKAYETMAALSPEEAAHIWTVEHDDGW